jgi:hypothetical protein
MVIAWLLLRAMTRPVLSLQVAHGLPSGRTARNCAVWASLSTSEARHAPSTSGRSCSWTGDGTSA